MKFLAGVRLVILAFNVAAFQQLDDRFCDLASNRSLTAGWQSQLPRGAGAFSDPSASQLV